MLAHAFPWLAALASARGPCASVPWQAQRRHRVGVTNRVAGEDWSERYPAKDGESWSLVGPSDFRNDQELRARISEAPEVLPLGGQPRIVAVSLVHAVTRHCYDKRANGGRGAFTIAVDPQSHPRQANRTRRSPRR